MRRKLRIEFGIAVSLVY